MPLTGLQAGKAACDSNTMRKAFLEIWGSGSWSPPGRLGIFNSRSPLKMSVSLLGTLHQVSQHQDVYKPCLNLLVRNLLCPISWKCASFNLQRDSVQGQAWYFKLSSTDFQEQRQRASWKATSSFSGHNNCYGSQALEAIINAQCQIKKNTKIVATLFRFGKNISDVQNNRYK